MSSYNLNDKDFNEIKFDEFREKIIHQAQGGGLVQKTTKVLREDPLLPNEDGSLCSVVKAHPLLSEFSDNVKKIKEFNNSQESPNKHLSAFVDALGTEDDFAGENLYGTIFAEYRKAMLMENDGQIKMPEHLEKILISTNKMVKAIADNPKMSEENKVSVLNTYTKELGNYFRDSAFMNLMQATYNYTHGFFHGVRDALNERHGGSLMESIGQVFKTGYEYAKAEHSNFLYYKDTMKQLHSTVSGNLDEEERQESNSPH